ncbi:MAG: DUF6285 domain-containing protein [Burkholderiales bacterium]
MSQNRPSVGDLLIAVQKFITECIPVLEGQARYHALSSAYLLGICERELRLGPDYDRAEAKTLSQFLGQAGTNAALRDALCAQIRAGTHDAAWQGLVDMVLAQIANDVRIVKPDHLAPEHRGDGAP